MSAASVSPPLCGRAGRVLLKTQPRVGLPEASTALVHRELSPSIREPTSVGVQK